MALAAGAQLPYLVAPPKPGNPVGVGNLERIMRAVRFKWETAGWRPQFVTFNHWRDNLCCGFSTALNFSAAASSTTSASSFQANARIRKRNGHFIETK
jgi:hypothetical protein